MHCSTTAGNCNLKKHTGTFDQNYFHYLSQPPKGVAWLSKEAKIWITKALQLIRFVF